jgi:gluconolactonase
MKKLAHAVVTCLLFGWTGCTFKSDQYYSVTDFTGENLFTADIEGPHYHNGILYVVNLERNGTIGQVDENGNVSLFVALPEGSTANAIKFNSKGDMLLADFTGHNILRVHMETKEVSVLAHNQNFNQPNDLCMNSRDQVFASDPNWQEGTGKLWRIEPDGRTILVADSLGTTNGIELSPDEKVLYVNESVQRKIWKFDVDQAGSLSNKTLFAEFSDHGFDGMKCDMDGNLYVTRYGKGTVAILSPEGNVIREVLTKGLKPSNITFGGEDGRTCYVTLQDRGCVETFRSEIPGKAYHHKLLPGVLR